MTEYAFLDEITLIYVLWNDVAATELLKGRRLTSGGMISIEYVPSSFIGQFN